ncbi:oxidoreductase [Asaia sp. BMEF1]|uniref:oxidoreductase n=1 Tax=Asaia sp. BMEF1 TaxID=3155932 RepID=UPI003F67BA58
MLNETINVVLVGYGYVGKTFHAPYIKSLQEMTLYGIVSHNSEKVHADYPGLKIYSDADDVFADENVDLVILATPNDTHAEYAEKALRAGKHVLVEKPFTLTVDEARNVIETARLNDRVLAVFHNRRWDSDFLTIRSAIERNLIGRVVHFESRIDRYRPEVRDRWREANKPGAGVLFDIGPHLIDQALQLFGLPDHVTASLANQRENSLIDDWAHIILCYGQKRVILHTSSLCASGSDRFVVHGTHGSLVKKLADPQEDQLRRGLKPGSDKWGDDPDSLKIYDADARLHEEAAQSGDQRNLYKRLAAAIRCKVPNPVRPIEALAVQAVLEAAYQSHQENRSVSLSLTEEERDSW